MFVSITGGGRDFYKILATGTPRTIRLKESTLVFEVMKWHLDKNPGEKQQQAEKSPQSVRGVSSPQWIQNSGGGVRPVRGRRLTRRVWRGEGGWWVLAQHAQDIFGGVF